jgi:hypothetical protein
MAAASSRRAALVALLREAVEDVLADADVVAVHDVEGAASGSHKPLPATEGEAPPAAGVTVPTTEPPVGVGSGSCSGCRRRYRRSALRKVRVVARSSSLQWFSSLCRGRAGVGEPGAGSSRQHGSTTQLPPWLGVLWRGGGGDCCGNRRDCHREGAVPRAPATRKCVRGHLHPGREAFLACA